MNEQVIQDLFDAFGKHVNLSSVEEFEQVMSNPEGRQKFFEVYQPYLNLKEDEYHLFEQGLGITSEPTFETPDDVHSEPQEPTFETPDDVQQGGEDVPVDHEKLFEENFETSMELAPTVMGEDRLMARDKFRQAEVATSKTIENGFPALETRYGEDWIETYNSHRQEAQKIDQEISQFNETYGNLESKDDSPEAIAEFEELTQQARVQAEELAEKQKLVNGYIEQIENDPIFKGIEDMFAFGDVLSEKKEELFPEKVHAERVSKAVQTITDAMEGSDIPIRSTWDKRRVAGLGKWMVNTVNDFTGLAASVADIIGADRAAAYLRVGETVPGTPLQSMSSNEDLMNIMGATVPTRLKGESVELQANFDDDKIIVFSEEGDPQFMRDKETGNMIQFKSGEEIEKAEKEFENAKKVRNLGRIAQNSEQSIYDMATSILITRGVTLGMSPKMAASTAGKMLGRGTIAGTTTIQTMGDEYEQALREGRDPSTAAVSSLLNATATGFLEAAIGNVELKASRLGIPLESSFRAQTTRRAKDAIESFTQGKITKNVMKKAVIKATYDGAKSAGGEVVEELIQQATTDLIDGHIYDEDKFHLTLLEAENILWPTLFTVMGPSTLSAGATYKNAVNDPLTRGLYESIKNKKVFEEALTKVDDPDKKQALRTAVQYVEDELSVYEVAEEAKPGLAGLILSKKINSAKAEQTENEKVKEVLLKEVESLQKKIDTIVKENPKSLDEQVVQEEEAKAEEKAKKEVVPIEIPFRLKSETVTPGNPEFVQGVPISQIVIDETAKEVAKKQLEAGVEIESSDAPVSLKYNEDGTLELMDGAHTILSKDPSETVDAVIFNVEQESEVYTPSEKNDIPITREQISVRERLSFQKDGTVTPFRVQSIADRMSSGETLTPIEQEMYEANEEAVDREIAQEVTYAPGNGRQRVVKDLDGTKRTQYRKVEHGNDVWYDYANQKAKTSRDLLTEDAAREPFKEMVDKSKEILNDDSLSKKAKVQKLMENGMSEENAKQTVKEATRIRVEELATSLNNLINNPQKETILNQAKERNGYEKGTRVTISQAKKARDEALKKEEGILADMYNQLYILLPMFTKMGYKVFVHTDPMSYANALEAAGQDVDSNITSKGFVSDSKEVHINADIRVVDSSTPAHEFIHPIVAGMIATNYELYEKFVDMIYNDPLLKRKYVNEFGEKFYEGTETQKEEAVVQYLAKEVILTILKPNTKFINTLRNVLLKFFKVLFNLDASKIFNTSDTGEFIESLNNMVRDGRPVKFGESFDITNSRFLIMGMRAAYPSKEMMEDLLFAEQMEINMGLPYGYHTTPEEYAPQILRIHMASRGWSRGTDGKWNREFENPETTWFSLQDEALPGTVEMTVGDFISKDSKVLKYYPEFADMKLTVKKTEGKPWGRHDNITDEIYIEYNEEADLRSNFLHEIQHAIQKFEQFPIGSSSRRIRNKIIEKSFPLLHKGYERTKSQFLEAVSEYEKNPSNFLLQEVRTLEGKLKRVEQEIVESLSPEEVEEISLTYLNSAGEVQSRNVQYREDNNISEDTPLWVTEDIVRKEQLVSYSQGKSAQIRPNRIVKFQQGDDSNIEEALRRLWVENPSLVDKKGNLTSLAYKTAAAIGINKKKVNKMFERYNEDLDQFKGTRNKILKRLERTAFQRWDQYKRRQTINALSGVYEVFTDQEALDFYNVLLSAYKKDRGAMMDDFSRESFNIPPEIKFFVLSKLLNDNTTMTRFGISTDTVNKAWVEFLRLRAAAGRIMRYNQRRAGEVFEPLSFLGDAHESLMSELRAKNAIGKAKSIAKKLKLKESQINQMATSVSKSLDFLKIVYEKNATPKVKTILNKFGIDTSSKFAKGDPSTTVYNTKQIREIYEAFLIAADGDPIVAKHMMIAKLPTYKENIEKLVSSDLAFFLKRGKELSIERVKSEISNKVTKLATGTPIDRTNPIDIIVEEMSRLVSINDPRSSTLALRTKAKMLEAELTDDESFILWLSRARENLVRDAALTQDADLYRAVDISSSLIRKLENEDITSLELDKTLEKGKEHFHDTIRKLIVEYYADSENTTRDSFITFIMDELPGIPADAALALKQYLREYFDEHFRDERKKYIKKNLSGLGWQGINSLIDAIAAGALDYGSLAPLLHKRLGISPRYILDEDTASRLHSLAIKSRRAPFRKDKAKIAEEIGTIINDATRRNVAESLIASVEEWFYMAVLSGIGTVAKAFFGAGLETIITNMTGMTNALLHGLASAMFNGDMRRLSTMFMVPFQVGLFEGGLASGATSNLLGMWEVFIDDVNTLSLIDQKGDLPSRGRLSRLANEQMKIVFRLPNVVLWMKNPRKNAAKLREAFKNSKILLGKNKTIRIISLILWLIWGPILALTAPLSRMIKVADYVMTSYAKRTNLGWMMAEEILQDPLVDDKSLKAFRESFYEKMGKSKDQIKERDEIIEEEIVQKGISNPILIRAYRAKRRKDAEFTGVADAIYHKASRLTQYDMLMGTPSGWVGQKVSAINSYTQGRSAVWKKNVASLGKLTILPFASVAGNFVNKFLDYSGVSSAQDAWSGIVEKKAPTIRVKDPLTGQFEPKELNPFEIKRRAFSGFLGWGLFTTILSMMMGEGEDEETGYPMFVPNLGSGYRITGPGTGSIGADVSIDDGYEPFAVQYYDEQENRWVTIMTWTNHPVGAAFLPQGMKTDAHLINTGRAATVGSKHSKLATDDVGSTLLQYSSFLTAQTFNQSISDMVAILGAVAEVSQGSQQEKVQSRGERAFVALAGRFVRGISNPSWARFLSTAIKDIEDESLKTTENKGLRPFFKSTVLRNNLIFESLYLPKDLTDGLGYPIVPDVDNTLEVDYLTVRHTDHSVSKKREYSDFWNFILGDEKDSKTSGIIMPNSYSIPDEVDPITGNVPQGLRDWASDKVKILLREDLESSVKDLKKVLKEEGAHRVNTRVNSKRNAAIDKAKVEGFNILLKETVGKTFNVKTWADFKEAADKHKLIIRMKGDILPWTPDKYQILMDGDLQMELTSKDIKRIFLNNAVDLSY